MADFEIEMKASVDSPEQIIERLRSIGAVFLGDYHKVDVYYRNSNYYSTIGDIRIRTIYNQDILTFKEKSIDRGMEFNREFETKVEDSEVIIELLSRIGFSEFIRKIKIGSAWKYNDLHIELSEVRGLGYYIELELVVPETGADRQKLALEGRQKIETVLFELEIKLSSIESKSYVQMLQALKS